ncbi:nucleotide modification associated domain-containing protein [Bradyrhizobium sp. AUGA SZCCT0431]|uniref:nucleotide modification associated domain-containing protein n=1 Tax=Bradyrhizobium sp. AUGA SZCCT0431 TaxID=2807674 RepID=UPI001BAA4B23|nr:nucleotide modification associated domain-containing protein [Bradyrhizobium sp. AUGA SZCCT0431]MBR1146664.1 DUF1599 domain-containing protein [Bradyrhizobium sp. AUGA SZCCT0431]
MAELYAANVEISRKKNSDYTNGDDAFKNFKLSAMLGIPVEQAILVRMSDKLSRIATLLHQDAQVADEAIGDTLSDLANYAVILRMYLETQNRPSWAEITDELGESVG